VRGCFVSISFGNAGAGGVFNNGGSLWAFASSISANVVAMDAGFAQSAGLENRGEAVLTACHVDDNNASAPIGVGGAGILNFGRLIAHRTSISRNRGHSNPGDAWGGGLINTATAVTELSQCNIDGNVVFSGGAGTVLGGGITNVQDARLAVHASSFRGNSAMSVSGTSVLGGSLYHESSIAVVLNGSLFDGSRVSGGVQGALVEGHQIFNGKRVTYVLPAPLGHWVPGVALCREIMCGTGPCQNQPCNVRDHPELENLWTSDIVGGGTNQPFPPKCDVGAYGSSLDVDDQLFPFCEGHCNEISTGGLNAPLTQEGYVMSQPGTRRMRCLRF